MKFHLRLGNSMEKKSSFFAKLGLALASLATALVLSACGGSSSETSTAKITPILTFKNLTNPLYLQSQAANPVSFANASPILPSPTGIVSYSTSDSSVASVTSGGTVTGLKVGSTTITASYPGDNNYTAASASYVLTVSRDVSNDLTVTINLDQALDFLDTNEFPTPVWTPPTSVGSIGAAMGLSLLDITGYLINANLFYLPKDVASSTNPFVPMRATITNNKTKSVSFTFPNELNAIGAGEQFLLSGFILDLEDDQYDCPGASSASSAATYTKSAKGQATNVVLNCEYSMPVPQ